MIFYLYNWRQINLIIKWEGNRSHFMITTRSKRNIFVDFLSFKLKHDFYLVFLLKFQNIVDDRQLTFSSPFQNILLFLSTHDNLFLIMIIQICFMSLAGEWFESLLKISSVYTGIMLRRLVYPNSAQTFSRQTFGIMMTI